MKYRKPVDLRRVGTGAVCAALCAGFALPPAYAQEQQQPQQQQPQPLPDYLMQQQEMESAARLTVARRLRRQTKT